MIDIPVSVEYSFHIIHRLSYFYYILNINPLQASVFSILFYIFIKNGNLRE